MATVAFGGAPAFGAPTAASALPQAGGQNDSQSGALSVNTSSNVSLSSGSSSSSPRGTTLFPLAALFYHKLTNVAYHRQKLRKINYDEISSMFFDKKVGQYMMDVFVVPPRNENDRRMIEKGEVPGVSDDLRRYGELRADIISFSDQYELNELVCLDYVIAIFRNPGLIRELERGDNSKPANYYDLNDHYKVIQAAMNLYVYERQAVLKSLILLLKLAYVSDDCASSENRQEKVGVAIVSEGVGDSVENDKIFEMCKFLIQEKQLGSRLIATAAKLFSKAKRRHGSSDQDSGYDINNRGSRGFLAGGLVTLLEGPQLSSSSGSTNSSQYQNIINDNNGSMPSGGSGTNNYLTSREGVLRQFEEMHALGEALFYSIVICMPTTDIVNKIQVLCSAVAFELMHEDDGVYGDGGDYGQDYSSAVELHQLYRSCLQSVVISLHLAHVQALKLLAMDTRAITLDNILELIPAEYRREMLETRARPLRWGDGILLFSFVHVLALRGGFEEASDDIYDTFGSGRATSLDSGSAEDSETIAKNILIFKGILAWIHFSRSFSFLRLGVLPVLQASCKSGFSALSEVETVSAIIDDASSESETTSDRGGPFSMSSSAVANTKLSFGMIPDIRYVNNTAGDLFSVLMDALETTADVFSTEELLEFHTNWFDISNLYAAVLPIYPSLSAKLMIDDDNYSFKPVVLSCLQYTLQNSKAIIPALHLLAGMAMGTESTLETVYRFLDKAGVTTGAPGISKGAGNDSVGMNTLGVNGAPGSGVPGLGRTPMGSGISPEYVPNMSLTHFMASIVECARICSGGSSIDAGASGGSHTEGSSGSSNGSILKENHEKVLMAIMSLFQAICRSPSVCELFLRDYRPLEVLFRLVCGPVSVSLKGSIFRTLSVIANSTTYVGPASGGMSAATSRAPGMSVNVNMAATPASAFEGAGLSVHEEMWRLIESHRLLPAPHESTHGTLNSLSSNNYGSISNPTRASSASTTASDANGNMRSFHSTASSPYQYTDGRGQGALGAGSTSASRYMVSSSTSRVGTRVETHSRGPGGGIDYDDDDVPLSYLQGLRLELEDSESKLGVYAITDSFLSLLEALLTSSACISSQNNSKPAHDGLGASVRYPGIIHYLEYVTKDVLLSVSDRFFINGAHGEGQRWRLLYRGFRILSAVLAAYPVQYLPALREKATTSEFSVQAWQSIGSGDTSRSSATPNINSATNIRNVSGSSDRSMLSAEESRLLAYLETDFDQLKRLASTTKGTSNSKNTNRRSTGPPSAGLYVMTLLLAWESPLRTLILQVLRISASDELEQARRHNIYASVVQASKMCANLGSSGRHLDTRLAYNGIQGQSSADGFFWRAKSIAAATELLYSVSVREQAFYKCVTSAVGAPKVGLVHVGHHGNSYAYSTVTIKSLSETLLSHKHALGSLVATCSVTGLLVSELDTADWTLQGNIPPFSSTTALMGYSVLLQDDVHISPSGISGMASSVLVKTIRDCTSKQGEEFLERLLTHPGNARADRQYSPSSSSLYPSAEPLQSGSGGGEEWSLLSLQRCLLDALRASLIDPSSHPRTSEHVCRCVVPLGGDLPLFIGTGSISSDDAENNKNDNDDDEDDSQGDAHSPMRNEMRGNGCQGNNDRDNSGASGYSAEQISAVVIKMLLLCLRADRLSLAHVLLGLTPAMDNTYGDRWDLNLGASFSSTGGWLSSDRHSASMHVPETVLGQILLLLEDTSDIIETQPYLATLCYELLHALCQQKLTSNVVLAFLRSHTVNSGGKQLKFIPFVIKQVVASLRLRPIYWSDTDNNTLKMDYSGTNSHIAIDASASASALCAAWALKMLALQYRAVEMLLSTGRSLLTTDIQELLALYITVIESNDEGEGEEGHSFIGFTELLIAAVNASNVSTCGLALEERLMMRYNESHETYSSGIAPPFFNLSGTGPGFDTTATGTSRSNKGNVFQARAADLLSNPLIANCVSRAAVPYSIGATKTGAGTVGASRYTGRPSPASFHASYLSTLSQSSDVDKEVATGDPTLRGQRNEEGNSNHGLGIFSVVDKELFSSVFWASVSMSGISPAKVDSNSNRGAGGEYGHESIDEFPLEVQHSLSLQAITLLNAHRRNLASSVFLLGAWEEAISVMISLLGRWLSKSSLEDGLHVPLATTPVSGVAMPSGSVLLYDRRANLRHYLTYMMAPLLTIFESNVHNVDSSVAELLASAVYNALNGEKRLSSKYYYVPALGSRRNRQTNGLISRRTLLGKRKLPNNAGYDERQQQQSVDEGRSSHASDAAGAGNGVGVDNVIPCPIRLSPRVLEKLISASLSLGKAAIRPIQAASRLRGLSFASIGAYLEPYLPLSYPFSGLSTGTYESKALSKSLQEQSGSRAGAYPVFPEELNIHADIDDMTNNNNDNNTRSKEVVGKIGSEITVRRLLSENVVALTEHLSREASEGPLIWNLASLSTLCRICALIDNDALAAVAQILKNNGRLAFLTRRVGLISDTSSLPSSIHNNRGSMITADGSTSYSHLTSGNGNGTVGGSGSQELRGAILSLCCHLTRIPEGHEAVTMAFGRDLCYQNLSQLFASYGHPSPSSKSSYSPLVTASSSLRRKNGETMEDVSYAHRWLVEVTPILNALISLALAPASSMRSQEGCSRFLCDNAKALAAILSGPWPNVCSVIQSTTTQTSAEQFEFCSNQMEACTRVSTILKVVSSSLASHSLQKELALRGSVTAAGDAELMGSGNSMISNMNASQESKKMLQSNNRGGGKAVLDTDAGISLEEEALELLSMSRRHVHSMTLTLLGDGTFSSNSNSSREMPWSLDSDALHDQPHEIFDDYGYRTDSVFGSGVERDGRDDFAGSSPLKVLVRLLKVLSRSLGSYRLSQSTVAGHQATVTPTYVVQNNSRFACGPFTGEAYASTADSFSSDERNQFATNTNDLSVLGNGFASDGSTTTTVHNHGWSTYHHEILTQVLTTLANLSVIIRNLSTAHSTLQRLSALAVGTIAERTPSMDDLQRIPRGFDSFKEGGRTASNKANNTNNSQNDSSVSRGASSSSGLMGSGGLFDLLFQFGYGTTPVTALPELSIRRMGNGNNVGASNENNRGNRFASGSVSGATSGNVEDRKQRILRLGEAINSEFLGLKFPIEKVMDMFLVLSSFNTLFVSTHEIFGSGASSANTGALSGTQIGGLSRNYRNGPENLTRNVHLRDADSNAAIHTAAHGGDMLQACLSVYAAHVLHALQNLIMVIYSEILFISNQGTVTTAGDNGTGHQVRDTEGNILLSAHAMSLLARVLTSARTSFVHLRKSTTARASGFSENFGPNSGGIDVSSGKIGSSRSFMAAGGSASDVIDIDGSLEVVAEIEKMVNGLRALQS